MKFDYIDKVLLSLLQRDCTLSLDQLAERTGSSKTPIWNRLKKLKQRGVIRQEVALCDPDALGLAACFFVLIQTSEHDAGWQQQFLSAVRNRSEVMEAHRLAGDVDYILKVRVADARAYDQFYQSLIADVKIFKVTALLSMEEVKYTTAMTIANDAAQ
ncbi:Lrp/AsnC family transcriptional regulator [Luminiphilus sp.]|jgi:Lrp/AsnC family transcriptional regulator|nr:Lrp/AsnC family transcriptional regulator [Luminiphilus sp.]MDC0411458.1 Lrp/AsnC family transcriptional regulator [Luminiphilus sp.]